MLFSYAGGAEMLVQLNLQQSNGPEALCKESCRGRSGAEAKNLQRSRITSWYKIFWHEDAISYHSLVCWSEVSIFLPFIFQSVSLSTGMKDSPVSFLYYDIEKLSTVLRINESRDRTVYCI